MAIPISSETPRSIQLRKIAEETDTEHLLAWPKPTEDDYGLFGKIVQFYSAFDFVLRCIAETMDTQGMFLAPWAGKAQKLPMAKVSEAIQSSRIWAEPNRSAFERIESHRRVRNLVAHFVVRRFPEEDAFIFMTKSASDYKQVYGREIRTLMRCSMAS
jgi:hypothetical protein